MTFFEEKMQEFARKGDSEKIKWMKNISSIIPPSQMKRIQDNDKSVLKELFVPKWVSWDLLYSWAVEQTTSHGITCVLCGKAEEHGLKFKERFICEHCFFELKNV